MADPTKAVKLAKGATPGSKLHSELTLLMCWSAVMRVVQDAGGKKKKTPKSYSGGDMEQLMSNAETVQSAADMAKVPAGELLVFFDGDKAIHAMLSVGSGSAAGTKNGPIVPKGKDCGYWETLDLTELPWAIGGGHYTVTRLDKSRDIAIRHRSIKLL